MLKFGLFATMLSFVGVLAFATLDTPPAAAADAAPCMTKDFKTEMVKQACTKGGQSEAKDAMKKFMKEKKFKSCNVCHAKLAPRYELKADGFEQFQKAGGK